MWPISFKAARKKMRQYSSKEKRVVQPKEVKDKVDDGDGMDSILPQMPEIFYECEVAFEEFVEHIPQDSSSPSKERYRKTL